MTRRLGPSHVVAALRVSAVSMACAVGLLTARVTGAQPLRDVPVAQVERPIAFDKEGRIRVVTPPVAARWKLTPPTWPLGDDWREARLYAIDTTATSAAVLVVQRVDGAVARYGYSFDALQQLRTAISAAVVAQGATFDSTRGTTGLEASTPAGNTFVRNQTVLGLAAYGPATAAILSDNGAAAAGGYFLAAGSSFFVAAQMIRNRSVTRAQTLLAFHGGTRGALAGAAVAAIGNARGGPGYGVPILVGALGGTVAGFRGAKAMSDGEAASSGFGADLFATTTLGLAGAIGAFDDDTTSSNNLPARAKIALGSALGTAAIGYAIGPRYARRADYNVTAGDIDVSFTSAALGGVAVNALLNRDADTRSRAGVTVSGLLIGALIADRTKVRHADRTSSDGTLVQLGAIAGALMGGGVALTTEANSRGATAMVAAGGVAGLLLADRLIRPAPDAGPKRGILQSSSVGNSARVSVAVMPALTTYALQRRTSRTQPTNPRAQSARNNVPVVRITF
ncbi:MAG: hypothetical protein IT353_23845 [Gemmatimonadaceae bacterium]|nr:hypothetical protein [Gemmatimonadaceae bacterium]